MVLMADVIDRIKQHLKTTSDADVARAFSVEPQNIVNWRKRGTVPWVELHDFALKNKISLEWLLTGEETTKDKSNLQQPIDINMLLKIIDQQNERIREQGLLLQAQGERITEQGKRIDIVTVLSSKATSENKDMWDKINAIEKILGRHYDKMLAAAHSGDLKALGE